jgi:hypothetical protein
MPRLTQLLDVRALLADHHARTARVDGDAALPVRALDMHEDVAIRAALMKQLKQAAVSKIVIERPHRKCRVTIHSGRPGVVIGKKGADIELMRMPSAPRRMADCTARFMARRKATRRSSCCAIDSATRVASISGLRTSTMPSTRAVRAW